MNIRSWWIPLEETGAYWVVREDFRRPRTTQTDFFRSLLVSLSISGPPERL
jgi:hypothetical protein